MSLSIFVKDRDIPVREGVGKAISLSRLGLGISRAELARRAGVAPGTVARYETKKNKKTGGYFNTVVRLLEACGLEMRISPPAIMRAAKVG